VSGPGQQRAQDEQIERALQQRNTGRSVTAHDVAILQSFV
jgi:hypothetical protein